MHWAAWGTAALLLQTLIVAATLLVMARVRTWAIEEMATPAGRRQWNAWREAARQQAEQAGPVRRRVPTSDEPPVVVLLRDHFATSAAATAAFLSILVWLTIGAIWGSWRRGRHRAGTPARSTPPPP